MPKKTKIIFISVFIIVGAIVFGVISLLNKKNNTPTDETTPWYQSFNPFGTSTPSPEPIDQGTTNQGGGIVKENSKFSQITDFAIAGATFLEDTRPIIYPGNENIPAPEPVTTIISADTKEGRKEIQIFLNKELSLKKPLVVDGVFGKSVTSAIKEFQKLNNLTITGKVDLDTAPFFIKTTTPKTVERPLTEQAPSIRYVERMNGHIYKMFLDTKIKEKISNSTIPGIYEALFNGNANTVIYRYLSSDNTISSFVATLGESSGKFLPKDISDLSVSPDKTNFFYLAENSNGVTGTIKTFDETKTDIVFSSPFTEWLSQWVNNQKIFLTTKASYSVDGSIFLLNTLNKTTSKIFGGMKGLTTLVSPNGSLVLYNTTTDTGPKLGIFDISKHTTKDLGTYGLPEKCIWSKDNITVYCAVPSVITGNQYPDYWYQGLISFDDYFVKINSTTGTTTTIANSTSETPIDGTYLFLSDTENLLFFTNKKDSTLWSLELK